MEGLPEALEAPEPVDTPGATTIEAVSGLLGVPAGALIKALPVVVDGDRPALALVRGDHRVNEIKLRNTLKAEFRPAREEEIGSPASFLGPSADVRTVFDAAIVPGPYVEGANREGEPGAVAVEREDRRDVRHEVADATVTGAAITI